MKENKFLSDGRKVSVIGKLNNVEWIVQEVFVTEKGDEIPSGESFTTKSLHDVPVESWLKKEEKKHQNSLDQAKGNLEGVRREIRKYDGLLSAKKDMLANSPELQSLFGEKAKILAMFMTGTVNYLVVNNYGLKKPQKMEELIIDWENGYGETRYESLKLASVLGRSKGDLEFRIHQYSDGSGGCGMSVYPFETYEEAVAKVKEQAIEKIEKGHLSKEDFAVCVELKIQFSDDLKAKIFGILSKSIQNGVDYSKKQIDESSKKIIELDKDMIALKAEISQ